MKDSKKNSKQIILSRNQALGILSGAVLTSIVGTFFTVVGIANSDHFTTVANAKQLTEIPATYVRKDVYSSDQKAILDRLDIIVGWMKRVAPGTVVLP